jgi:cell division protein FtsL
MAAIEFFAPVAEAAEPVRAPQRRLRSTAARPATPVRSRRRLTRRRVRGHIVWMILFALLLSGVVAVNVAVLRAHVAVTRLDDQSAELKAQNQALASRLSAASSAPRIEAAAHRLGLVQAPAAATSYLDLAPARR